MALSFPLSPTAGQQYVGDGVTYEYNGTLSAWVKLSAVQSALPGAAAQTGAAIIPGGDDTERAAITTPAAGMLRYNDQAGFPAVMEYYDGIQWVDLATAGGGNVNKIWALTSMPDPVLEVLCMVLHPVSLKFGALCKEYSGQARLYESSDGVSWTRGSHDLGTSIGSYLSYGKGTGWIAGYYVNLGSGSWVTPYILPSLTAAPISAVDPFPTPVGFGNQPFASSIAYVASTDQYVVLWVTGNGSSLRAWKSPDAQVWTSTLNTSIAALGLVSFGSDFGSLWAISGNVVWPTFACVGTSGNFLPRSSDGGNSWTLDPWVGAGVGNAAVEAYTYYNGVWLKMRRNGGSDVQSYATGTAAPTSFTSGGPNPWTVASNGTAVGISPSSTASRSYYPGVVSYPGIQANVLFLGSSNGTFTPLGSAHSSAVNTSIAMVPSTPYYYISK